MKKLPFLFLFLCLVVVGHSQSLENLGDGCFANGQFGEAAVYYEKANKLEPSSQLKDKLKKSRSLKYEFEIIDTSIASEEFDKARIHIEEALRIDPGNYWALEKQRSIATKISKKRELAFTKGFDGGYFPQKRFHQGFMLSGGVSYDLKNDMISPIFRFSYANYKKFPYSVDFSLRLNDYSDKNGYLIGLGGRGAYFLSKNWKIDYGMGITVGTDKFDTFQENFNPNTGTYYYKPLTKYYTGLYTKVGITFHNIISYCWIHDFVREYPVQSNGHFIILTYPIPF